MHSALPLLEKSIGPKILVSTRRVGFQRIGVMMKTKYWWGLILNLLPVLGFGSQFVSPIGGIPYQDWTIVNYVDIDPTSEIMDWNGGTYSYDGHEGIDFTLANFAKMDAGVEVLASADGVVVDIEDGHYDRWSSANPNFLDVSANFVYIQHANDVMTSYWHLKKNSILVSIGESVSAGQKIALVGSSGRSTDPHLHFEVYDDYETAATYVNPGQWWLNPVGYPADNPRVLDFGITDHYPSSEEIVERPVGISEFNVESETNLPAISWLRISGIDTDDVIEYSLIDPDGEVDKNSLANGLESRFGYWTFSKFLNSWSKVGLWQVVVKLNGDVVGTDSFLVTNPSRTNEIEFIPSCLAGYGRVDLNVVNRSSAALYRLEFQGLNALSVNVGFKDWGRIAITGRPAGDYAYQIYRNNSLIMSDTVSLYCDQSSPSATHPEVTIVNACRYGNGYILFQMANSLSFARSYVVEFQGVSNRSTTAAAFGQALRGTSGRPDGLYSYSVRVGSTVLKTGQLVVDCD